MSDFPTPAPSATPRRLPGTLALPAVQVLVADADPASRLTRERHLRTAGASVLTARTGFEAIVKASCQLPDLIVLDASIGELEMAETARLLTTCPVTARTPVLCLPLRRRVPRRVLAGLRRQVPAESFPFLHAYIATASACRTDKE